MITRCTLEDNIPSHAAAIWSLDQVGGFQRHR